MGDPHRQPTRIEGDGAMSQQIVKDRNVEALKLAARQPGQVLPLALAGYFQVRAGQDVPGGIAKLDDAASRDLGPSQYYRGLALAELPASAGHAEQAIADLEFVLAVRDQFPSNMIRAA